jgi:NhaA family Na+:H+ antiporter
VQAAAERVFQTLERFLHIEAVSGIALMISAVAAVVWANSPFAETYEHLWHTPLSIGIGRWTLSEPLHFWINDALMTVFFLVVGMEIRREMYEGALADVRAATLPVIAALGGVLVPALIYLSINGGDAIARDGWAVPTATDIAFAVGVLALLGKSIPANVRVFLLAIAIIDDIVAVIIIALFHSSGFEASGLLIAGVGVLGVLALQQIGIGSALAYAAPGAIVWWGVLKTGAHPTLAGVLLGLMTPVTRRRTRFRPFETAAQSLRQFYYAQAEERGARELLEPLKQLREAQRDLVPPVVRVQTALHPWVAFGAMPLFALANAGVRLDGLELGGPGALPVLSGVAVGLLLGKPAGIVLATFTAVRAGACRLPDGMSWGGVALVGCLGGVGFTMSIFIATLAFDDENLLAAAKAGVLTASVAAGIAGFACGRTFVSRGQRE